MNSYISLIQKSSIQKIAETVLHAFGSPRRHNDERSKPRRTWETHREQNKTNFERRSPALAFEPELRTALRMARNRVRR